MNIAIIAGSTCPLAEASSVAAAIQQHVTYNFQPVWQIGAVVTALESLEAGYVPIFVVAGPLQAGFSGFHTVESDGSYYAVVEYGPTWALAASHECLEMIVDPSGDRKSTGFAPIDTPSHVSFLVEVCDPCQDISNARTMGVWPMSDFVYPSYFEDQSAPGKTYSLSGNLKAAKQVLPGGSLSWIDEENIAWQLLNDNGQEKVVKVGPFQPGPMAAREYMQQFEPEHGLLSNGPKSQTHRRQMEDRTNAFRRASASHSKKFLVDMQARSAGSKPKRKPQPIRRKK